MKHSAKIVRLKIPPREEEKEAEILSAAELEKAGKLKQAATLFLKLVKKYPVKEINYTRLMIIYRKLKEPQKELAIIDQAIATFRQYFHPASSHAQKKVIALSKQINFASGLTDKKGKLQVETEPIATWQERRRVVEKKIKGR